MTRIASAFLACALCLGGGFAATVAQEIPAAPARGDAPMALRTREPGGGYVGDILSAYLSRDGSVALAATTEGTIGVWETKTGWLRLLLSRPVGRVRASSVLTDPDSRWILGAAPWMRILGKRISGWRGGILQAWESGTGAERFRFVNDEFIEIAAVDDGFDHVALIDDQYRMMVVKRHADKHVATLADVVLRPSEEFEPNSQWIAGADAGFSADVHRAIAIAREKDSPRGVLLYDARAWKVRFQPASAYCDAIEPAPGERDQIGVTRAALSADGRIIALRLSARPTCIDLFDFDTDAHVGSLTLEQGDGVALMQFDDAGQRLAVATSNGPVRIFDLATGKQVAVGDGVGIGPVWAMRFVNSKLQVLSGADKKKEMNRREYEAARARGEELPKIHLWSVPLPH